jgi:hypothetical protein
MYLGPGPAAWFNAGRPVFEPKADVKAENKNDIRVLYMWKSADNKRFCMLQSTVHRSQEIHFAQKQYVLDQFAKISIGMGCPPFNSIDSGGGKDELFVKLKYDPTQASPSLAAPPTRAIAAMQIADTNSLDEDMRRYFGLLGKKKIASSLIEIQKLDAEIGRVVRRMKPALLVNELAMPSSLEQWEKLRR